METELSQEIKEIVRDGLDKATKLAEHVGFIKGVEAMRDLWLEYEDAEDVQENIRKDAIRLVEEGLK